MPNPFYRRGLYAEYLLLRKLRRMGWFALRAPRSGGMERLGKYPDIIAIKYVNGKHRIAFIEVKLRKHVDTIHINAKKWDRIIQEAMQINAETYIVVYVTNEKRWYVFNNDQLERQRTEKGDRYVITCSKYKEAKTLKEVFG